MIGLKNTNLLEDIEYLCFSGCSENQDGCPSLWLAETFLLHRCNLWKEFIEIWQQIW